MKAHGIAQEESRQPVEVTAADAIQAMCMVGIEPELMRRLMAQATQEGISPVQLIASAISDRIGKNESTGTSERRLLLEDK